MLTNLGGTLSEQDRVILYDYLSTYTNLNIRKQPGALCKRLCSRTLYGY
jgi:hypothetical protein